ncbi:hypothetical protein [Haliscomenobacter sp.]|uniref:hypothetical protein n=1 Tax=Haliscomenobacter sp. TaxID=2717303 RepID=UPI003BABDB90
MKKLLSVIWFIAFVFALQAQDSTKVRLNFAQTYLELGTNIYPSFTGRVWETSEGGVNQQHPLSFSPMLNIGGIHFWGRGDFYISVPFASLATSSSDQVKAEISESVVTGMRLMPWALKSGQLTPYLGAAWIVSNFRQKVDQADNPLFNKNELRLDGGFLYGKQDWLFRLGVNGYPKHRLDYPVDATHFQTIQTPALSANLGIIYTFETTAKGMKPEVANQLNTYANFSKPDEAKSHFGDWFFGIGPSTSFVLESSAYNQKKHAFVNQRSISKTYLDLALGYHFNQARMVTALAYRHVPFKEKAYGLTQNTVKNSLLFETYYYLLDYHGFTPYIGLNVGIDKLVIKENEALVAEKNQVTPGITFGWDILPGKTEQAFVLRTNLRWVPFQKISINGEIHSMNQLEYNVIQAVWYPSRKKWYK